MNKSFFLLLFAGLSIQLQAQTLKFLHGRGPTVEVGADTLDLPWAGGLNYAQVNALDINNDGTSDLLVFDRSGNRILPLIFQSGSGVYRYEAKWRDSLPPIESWVKVHDYNCDGKPDLFVSVPGGIMVYQNVSSAGGCKFNKALTTPWLTTTYNQPTPTNLYVTSQDIPSITDVDGDSKLDIITFGIFGTTVERHEAVTACGLDMALDTNCWGDFSENFNNNSVEFDVCSGNVAPPQGEKTQHSGSTILVLDLDGDGNRDALLGDISFNNATAVYNCGDNQVADMCSQDTTFPNYNTPVDLYVFPSFWFVDIDQDGKRDLVASPNINGSQNHHSVWYYRNTNTDASPTFTFQRKDLFQEHMIEMGEHALPVLADLNGDGLKDLVVANLGFFQSGGNYRPAFHLYHNTGTAQKAKFTLQDTNFIQVNTFGLGPRLAPTFADLDGDGDLDMVLGDNDGKLHYFANTGSATNPQFALTIPQLGGFDVGNAASPFLYDVDGDGDFDLVVGEEAGNLNLIRNTGSSSSAAWTFETSNFGGINVKGIYGNGFSTPVVFPFAGRNMMVVGSRDKGLVIADSLEQVVSNPLGFTGSWDSGTQLSTGNDLTPMGSGKRTGRNQLLIKATELKAKGFKYGKITSLGFEVGSTNNFPLSNGVTFGMKQANLSSLDGFETGFTEVYNGVGSFAPGWNDITLQNPFTWDGVSDLVIQVCFSRNIPNTTIDVYLHDAGFNANAFGDVTNWNTNAADGCQMPYKNSSTLRPNFRMGFVPSFRENAVGIVRGEYLAPAIGYLTQDSIPELLLGNVSGGVEFFTSEKLAGSLSQPELPLEMAPVFLAWPNPAQQNISVRLMQETQPRALIRMLDVQGRVVYQKEQFEIIQTHALPALPAGIYILEVSSGKDLQREKWIIKR